MLKDISSKGSTLVREVGARAGGDVYSCHRQCFLIAGRLPKIESCYCSTSQLPRVIFRLRLTFEPITFINIIWGKRFSMICLFLCL